MSTLVVDYYTGFVLISIYISIGVYSCIVPHKPHAVQMLLNSLFSGLIPDVLSLYVRVLVSVCVCISFSSVRTVQVIWCW